MTTTPRVDALIERVMDEHPSVGRAAQAAYYEAVHQELAPLARELEAGGGSTRREASAPDEQDRDGETVVIEAAETNALQQHHQRSACIRRGASRLGG
jgi:hypothetical protein